MQRSDKHFLDNVVWEWGLFGCLSFVIFIFYGVSTISNISVRPAPFAMDNQNNFYVANDSKSIIQNFDASGFLLKSFGGEGNGNGQFGNYSNMDGIAIDSKKRLFVTDSKNNRIQVFTLQGQFLSSWAVLEVKDQEGCGICLLAIDNQDNLYLAGYNSPFIRKFDPNGRVVAAWGEKGTGESNLNGVEGIAIDSQNRLYVSDSARKEIKIFDPQGTFLTKWNISRTDSSDFSSRGIAIDKQNNLYLAYNGQILKFNNQGQIVKSWQLKGFGSKYDNIKTIVVDQQGYINILWNDTTIGHVQKFDNQGNYITQWVIGTPDWWQTTTVIMLYIIIGLAAFLIFNARRRKKSSRVFHTNLAEAKLKSKSLSPRFSDQLNLTRIRRNMKKTQGSAKEKLAEANKTVRLVVEELPEAYQPIPVGSYGKLLWAGFLLLCSAFFIIPSWGNLLPVANIVVETISKLPFWAIFAGIIIASVLLLLLPATISVISGSIRPSRWSLSVQDWFALPLWLGIWVSILLLVNLIHDQINRWFNYKSPEQIGDFSYVAIIADMFVPYIFYFLLWAGLMLSTFWWVRGSWKQGDYEGALRRANLLRIVTINSLAFRSLQSATFIRAGQYEEATLFLRQSLSLTKDTKSKTQANVLEQLGEVLLRQRHYSEAINVLEKAIELNPKGGSGYSGLAEVYLEQGIKPERALELLDQARDNKQKSFTTRMLEPSLWGEILANRAWALALLGYQDETTVTLEQAFKETNHKFKPGMAGLHYRVGQVYCTQALYEKATIAFNKVTQLDRQGTYNLLARQALQQIETRERFTVEYKLQP